MKVAYHIVNCLLLLLLSSRLFAQQEEQPQKSPSEMASIQADDIQKQLKLNDTQVFYIDSILQHNYTAISVEFEKMKKAGIQSSENYMTVQKIWNQKTEDAFKKVLTEEQFINYLKITRRYKDYKKRMGIK
ncbi:hypothetical protein SDC9_173239 [bioreactor metagenome]|uniref:Uncharacterized protein n=1 Tax=bioreactor metagenome TaxID=1076179 RepID=A0A645GQ79_9ZZZZ